MFDVFKDSLVTPLDYKRYQVFPVELFKKADEEIKFGMSVICLIYTILALNVEIPLHMDCFAVIDAYILYAAGHYSPNVSIRKRSIANPMTIKYEVFLNSI